MRSPLQPSSRTETGLSPRNRKPALWCGVVLTALAFQAAIAQLSTNTQQMSTGPNQSAIAAILQAVAGEPYQAEKVTRSVQTLSDGTVITHESRGMIARDAEGRIREDLYQTISQSVNGTQMDANLQSATVGDPTNHTLLFWTGDESKIAMKMQLPSIPASKGAAEALMVAPPPAPRGPAGSQTPQSLHENAAPSAAGTAGDGSNPFKTASAGNVHTEDLGKQSLEGILVTGTRTTTTIPTGKVGNDRPIIVVHEEWRSPELKIVVKTIDRDPRTGEQTVDLEKLVRTDPDASLFQPPAGYKVQDMAQMFKALGNIGRTKPQ
jgi:hypothetical protein